MHGQFVWYELTTPDVDAAQKFYPRFTSWGTQRFDSDYTMWTHSGTPIAGIFRLNDEMKQQGVPPNWMPYIESSDVDATATKAASLGGTVVVAPAEIPGTGRFAVIQDPQGATFGIYKSNTESRSWDGTPVVGRMSWHELMTSDPTKAYDFYRALFGWDKTGEMDMGDGTGMYTMVGKGAAQYGGMFKTPNEMASMPPFWLVYIHVKDVARAVATATKAGAAVVRPQMDIPGGQIAILADPQGAGFAVHQGDPQAKPAKPAAKPAKPTAKPAAKPAAKVAPKAAAKPAKKASAKKAAPKAARKKVAKKSVKRPAKKSAKPARRASKPARKGAARKASARRKKAGTRRGKARGKR